MPPLTPLQLHGAEDAVRLPRQIHDSRIFDVPRGIVLDLTRSHFLSAEALPGLIRRQRLGPVRLLLVEESQPYRMLSRHFSSLLQPSLVDGEWLLSQCPHA